jgi:hypothetical protein
VSEIGFTGDVTRRDTGIEAIMFSLLFVPNDREERFQIREFL